MAISDEFVQQVFRLIRVSMDNGRSHIGFADVSALCDIGRASQNSELAARAARMQHDVPPHRQYETERVKPLLEEIEADYRSRSNQGAASPASDEPQAEPEPEPEPPQSMDEADYEQWSKRELLRTCQERGLQANNQMNKADLVARLRQEDRAQDLTDGEMTDAEERFAEQASPEVSVETNN